MGWAVANGQRTAATLLIDEYKSDLQCRYSNGRSLLHLAAEKSKPLIVELLITKYKFDPNVTAMDESIPLHLTGNVATARKLIQLGGDVNARDSLGHTPLHNAYMIKEYYERDEMVKLLIHSGSDTQSRDKKGHTPLELFNLLEQEHFWSDL